MAYQPSQKHTSTDWNYRNESSSTQTDTSVKAAPGANVSIYITDVYAQAKGAVEIFLEHGSTELHRIYCVNSGDGSSFSMRTPIKVPANTALTYSTDAAVEHTVTILGYTAPG